MGDENRNRNNDTDDIVLANADEQGYEMEPIDTNQTQQMET